MHCKLLDDIPLDEPKHDFLTMDPEQRKQPPKEAKTFRLDSDTIKVLESAAEAQNRTLSNMVETLLKEKARDLTQQLSA